MNARELLTIVAHKSRSYGPRTYQNARVADLTAAFALDFATPGERVTRSAADRKYIAMSGLNKVEDSAVLLLEALQKHGVRILNVAGNGIYTLQKRKVTQARINQYVYTAIAYAHSQSPLTRIVSGGQTGADIAGAVAGVALGIPVVLTLPAGLLQRGADGVDREHTEEDIRAQVHQGVAALKRIEEAIAA